ncbi:MAG TPA: cytochrome c [Bacteroidales bacterium]|nr:cytochrome c [Bacteroidales bacterium]
MKKTRNYFVPVLLLLFTASVLFLSCCEQASGKSNAGNKVKTQADNTSVKAASTTNQDKVPEGVMKRGATVYRTYCLACHQTDGSGNPGMYPPLNQTKMVLGDKKPLIRVILNGLSGKIEVKGETYYQAMAPHNFLSDQQIADLLTYVRNSFGNSASMVRSEEVKEARAAAD